MIRYFFALILAFTCVPPAHAQDTLRLAVTTSFQNSGLSDVLLPAISRDLDIEVQLLVVGTGQALRLGRAGDVDALLVHARAAEDAFISEGYAPYRREIMYNDFIIVGPKTDPADLRGQTSAQTAFATLFNVKKAFVSRGDESGTHQRERALWSASHLSPETFGPWYLSVGAGMGAALNTAAGLDAYTFSDRGSWLNFKNRGNLDIVFEGDPQLRNQYAYLPVSEDRHPHVKVNLNKALEHWLTSQSAQDLINSYRLNGERAFTFNATAKP